MGSELVGIRLLTTRFGASTYVWGSVLGTVMAALAGGYLVGGRLADRWPRPVAVHGCLLAGALSLLPVLFVGPPLLAYCERFGAVVGPLAAAVALFAVPLVALGAASPFAVRLLAHEETVGTVTGRVFAVATGGSLCGTFLTAFWLTPWLGSRTTLRVWIAALLVSAVVGLATVRRRRVALLGLGLLLLAPDPAPGPDVLVRGESAYNVVVVEEHAGVRRLLLNDERFGIHSVRPADGPLTGLYFDAFHLGPVLASGTDILVLGMAGGTTIAGHRRLFPGARITAVELDPLVVDVARRYFDVAAGPHLTIHVADARAFLAQSTQRFDVIEADLFAGGVYPPFHTLTQEFFALASARLRPGGLVAVNVLALGGDDGVVGVVAATMATAFPAVFELPLRNQRILFGLREPVDVAGLRRRLDAADVPELGDVIRAARARLRPAVGRPGGTQVLTDDRAPVERLTNAMLARRAGGTPGPGDGMP